MEHKRIYHITHLSNLPGILSEGKLWCDVENAVRSSCRQSIGHQNIKERRLRKAVETTKGSPVSRGGYVGDYVPFYFTVRSPMLFTLSRGNVENFTGNQGEIIYLVSSTKEVLAAGLNWCFTSGHAIEGMSEFFDDLSHLDRIDWDIIKGKVWHNTLDQPDRKRKKQAEFLVHHFFPWQCVIGLATISEPMAERVREVLVETGVSHQPQVKALPQWYY